MSPPPASGTFYNRVKTQVVMTMRDAPTDEKGAIPERLTTRAAIFRREPEAPAKEAAVLRFPLQVVMTLRDAPTHENGSSNRGTPYYVSVLGRVEVVFMLGARSPYTSLTRMSPRTPTCCRR
jgi:hypothetical protein